MGAWQEIVGEQRSVLDVALGAVMHLTFSTALLSFFLSLPFNGRAGLYSACSPADYVLHCTGRWAASPCMWTLRLTR
jgi:hypothetical protein